MKFSTSDSMTLLPDDAREVFNDLVQKEIDAKDPATGAKLLYNRDPRQLQFKFTYSKEIPSQ